MAAGGPKQERCGPAGEVATYVAEGDPVVVCLEKFLACGNSDGVELD